MIDDDDDDDNGDDNRVDDDDDKIIDQMYAIDYYSIISSCTTSSILIQSIFINQSIYLYRQDHDLLVHGWIVIDHEWDLSLAIH